MNFNIIFSKIISILILINTLLIFINDTSLAIENKEDLNCDSIITNLQIKNNNLVLAIESVNLLLDSKSSVDLPLSALFQIDLRNDNIISDRITELSNQITEEEILKLPEYNRYLKCSLDEKQSVLLKDVAKKQTILNKKKLTFLKLNKSFRDSLVATFEENRQQLSNNQILEKQLSESKQSLESAQSNLIGNENDLSNTVPLLDEPLSSARSILEKFAIDIETEQIEFINNIKFEREKLAGFREKLPNQITNHLQPEEFKKEFLSVDFVWRSAAERLLDIFTKIDISSKYSLPAMLDLKPSESNSKISNQLLEYTSLHKKIQQRVVKLSEQRHNLLLDLKSLNFHLVNDSGRIRAKLISQCKATNSCDLVSGFNEKSLTGIVLELRILPLRFLAGALNKLVEFKAKIDRGIEGWTDVAKQLLIFIFLTLLPFIVHKMLNWLSNQLNRLREKILSRSLLDYRRRTQIVFWIGRLNPFIPSCGMFTSIHFARSLIETTDLKEISYLLFYLEIYFVYRATRLLFKTLIELLFSSETLAKSNELSAKAEVSAKRLSRYFFGRYVLLHAIEDTVRRALVFGIAYEVFTWVSIFVVINELRNWQTEIYQAFETRFSKLWLQIKLLSNKRIKYFLIPFLLVAVVGYDAIRWISLRLVRFDFFKRLVSDVFRKRLEKDIDFSQQLNYPNQTYLSVFDYYLPAKKDFYIDREPLMAKKILSSINNWLNNQTYDDLFILVGNRGIGKTTSAKMIFDTVNTINKSFRWVDPKIYNSKEFFYWLSELIGKQLTSLEDFIQFESMLENKLVLIVDDIHNLFIGKIGGFEAYRLFMEIISLKTKNIFWCLTSNYHAWIYLQGVFGEEHFYGQVYEMRMWTDIEIQNLILTRHKSTHFSMSFDKSISAYGTGNVLGEKVDTQFFRLLWGQSRGNPRSALMSWVSAVSESSDKEIHVGVPRFINSSLVGTMSNEALMILAAVSKHDSLTMEEITDVTRINRLIVRKVIKESTEKELIWIDEKERIRISSRAQNAIDYYLIGKNFLYE